MPLDFLMLGPSPSTRGSVANPREMHLHRAALTRVGTTPVEASRCLRRDPEEEGPAASS